MQNFLHDEQIFLQPMHFLHPMLKHFFLLRIQHLQFYQKYLKKLQNILQLRVKFLHAAKIWPLILQPRKPALRSAVPFLFLFVLMDAISLNLNLQKRTPDLEFLQLSTLLPNINACNIRILETCFLFLGLKLISLGVVTWWI